MNKQILKSIGAIVAGFVIGATLSVGTDFLFDHLGILSIQDFRNNPALIVVIVIVYRFIFNVTGSYWTAKLAPNNPMKHALILGITGTVIGVLGSFVMWEQANPWYNMAIILISIPCAWIGGKLFISKSK